MILDSHKAPISGPFLFVKYLPSFDYCNYMLNVIPHNDVESHQSPNIDLLVKPPKGFSIRYTDLPDGGKDDSKFVF